MSRVALWRGPDDDARPPVDWSRHQRHRLPNYLRETEFTAVVEAAQRRVDTAGCRLTRLRALRDRLLVSVCLYTGVRVGELVSLRIEHIDLATGILTVYRGKLDKDRALPIPAKLLAMLKDWIGEQTRGWLFVGDVGYHLQKRTVNHRFNLLGKAAGLSRLKLKPHTARHTFATRLLASGATIKEVQELLGHSSLRSTEVYLHCEPEQLRAAVERL